MAVWTVGEPTAEARQFWTKTTWVRIADATWFTDLAAEGELYAAP